MDFYNRVHRHQELGIRTPDQVYYGLRWFGKRGCGLKLLREERILGFKRSETSVGLRIP